MLNTIENKANFEQHNKNSLFLLPTIYAFISVFLWTIISGVVLFNVSDWTLLEFFSNLFFSNLYTLFVEFFTVGFFVLFIQKVYEINRVNILLLLAFILILQLSSIFIVAFLNDNYLYFSAFELQESLAFYVKSRLISWSESLTFIFDIFYYHVFGIFMVEFIFKILFIILAVAIGYIIFFRNRLTGKSYRLIKGSHSSLYAFIFTLIFIFPINEYVVIFVDNFLSKSRLNFSSFYQYELNYEMIYGLLQSSVLPINLLIFISIFLGVKNCFSRQFNYIPLKLIFKVVGLAYLYLLALSIVSVTFLYLIISYLNNQSFLQSILLFFLFLIFIIGFFGALRQAVKRYFFQKIDTVNSK